MEVVAIATAVVRSRATDRKLVISFVTAMKETVHIKNSGINN